MFSQDKFRKAPCPNLARAHFPTLRTPAKRLIPLFYPSILDSERRRDCGEKGPSDDPNARKGCESAGHFLPAVHYLGADPGNPPQLADTLGLLQLIRPLQWSARTKSACALPRTFPSRTIAGDWRAGR
jgi:hypothetical protein